MPQELRVVRCYRCCKFQVDIVKKAKKWECKLCGAKQSLVKEYARGSGKDCRLLVQEITDKAIAIDQQEGKLAEMVALGKLQLPAPEETHDVQKYVPSTKATGSKWDSYRAKDEPGENDESSVNIFASTSTSDKNRPYVGSFAGQRVDRGGADDPEQLADIRLMKTEEKKQTQKSLGYTRSNSTSGESRKWDMFLPQDEDAEVKGDGGAELHKTGTRKIKVYPYNNHHSSSVSKVVNCPTAPLFDFHMKSEQEKIPYKWAPSRNLASTEKTSVETDRRVLKRNIQESYKKTPSMNFAKRSKPITDTQELEKSTELIQSTRINVPSDQTVQTTSFATKQSVTLPNSKWNKYVPPPSDAGSETLDGELLFRSDFS